jgi:hypothetical protein
MTTRSRNGKSSLALALLIAMELVPPLAARAQPGADDLPARLLFAVSGGFWKGDTKLNTSVDEAIKEADGSAASKDSARGYYRISAYRTDDDTSRLFLQRIVLAKKAPEAAESMEIDAINALHAYVTDIRQDNASGLSATEGFSAFVALKRDPKAAEPETWTVLVDEYGTVTVEKPTN